MPPDKAGPVVIGEKIKVTRKHGYCCANCLRWDQLKEDQGICRLRRPAQTVIGIGEGMDRSPRPVTHPIYDITQASDVCALHPELLRNEIVQTLKLVFQAWDTRVTWDREKGFNRAPDIATAQHFAVDPDADKGKPG